MEESIESIKNKICKGCSHKEFRCYLIVHSLEDIKKCPCIICLIKMICVKGCAPYRKYSKYVLKKAEVNNGTVKESF